MKRKNIKWIGALLLSAGLLCGWQAVDTVTEVQAAQKDEEEAYTYELVKASAYSGTFGKNEGVSWYFDESSETLVISGEDYWANGSYLCQDVMGIANKIKCVKFENCRFIESELAAMFRNMTNLKDIDFSGLELVEPGGNVSGMFDGCSSLERIDLSSLNIIKTESTRDMFYGCSNLDYVDISNLDLTDIQHDSYCKNMFYGCSSLKVVKTPKKIGVGLSIELPKTFDDTQAEGKWYTVMSSINEGKTLMSRDANGWSLKKDIYYWYKDGVKQNVTVPAGDPKGTLGANKRAYWYYDKSSETLVVSGHDTQVNGSRLNDDVKEIKTQIKHVRFEDCTFTDINLSGIFSGMSALEEADLTSLNITGLTDVSAMFSGCSSLSSVNISNLDFTNVTSYSDMFKDCVSLDVIKTPKQISSIINIEFPRTFDDKASDAFYTIMSAANAGKTLTARYADGWNVKNGKYYWYENGVKQGTEGRGKEIYDPESDAWYWLDSIQGGAKAVSKDVYQESSGGKWVRYDSEGHMIKGWHTTDVGTYYFDPVTGAMSKGSIMVDGLPCMFDENTGIGLNNQWVNIDGKSYWYENGKRQGYDPFNPWYRGKEIYDSESDAWYWLDSVQEGAKAMSKDVYQESWAGEYADREDGTGKWVRYDSKGHMIKGWHTTDAGKYYFDPTTGAMAKGKATINKRTYYFDESTGILK